MDAVLRLGELRHLKVAWVFDNAPHVRTVRNQAAISRSVKQESLGCVL